MTQDNLYEYDLQASDVHHPLFGHPYDVAGYYGELNSFNCYHPHPFYCSNTSSQEENLHCKEMAEYRNRNVTGNASSEEANKERCLPHSEQGNWLGDYDLFSGDYWREVFYSISNNNHQGAYPDALEKTEPDQSEEDCASYVSYQGDSEYNPPTCDYDFWSSYRNWIGCGEPEDTFDNGVQEPEVTYSYGHELGFCEGILGHWPCLYQKIPHYV